MGERQFWMHALLPAKASCLITMLLLAQSDKPPPRRGGYDGSFLLLGI